MKRILLPFIIILLMSGNTAWAGGLFPGTSGVSDAKDVKFDNTEASLTGDPYDVQGAIEAVKTEIGNISAGTLADIDDLPGDEVDDDKIDSILINNATSTGLGVASFPNTTFTVSTAGAVSIKAEVFQPYDADLDTFAGITPSANVQTVLGCSTYADIRTALGLVIGTNVLAPDGDGSSLTGLTWSQIGSTPTTLSGYGITDGATATSPAITFTHTGQTFAPVIVVDGTPEILWSFADGTTSTSATPSIDFGTAATRQTTLRVTPWSALVRINVGYNAGDGGSAAIEQVPNQYVTAVDGLEVAAPTLQYFCISLNPITRLNFDNFTNLDTLECFRATSLQHVSLKNCISLQRLCLEDCALISLDISECPNLADLRGALNTFNGIDFGTIGQDIWHICIRENSQVRTSWPSMTQFPLIEDIYVWNTNQYGELRTTSTALRSVQAQSNHYTSADFTGGFPGTSGTINISHNDLTSLVVDGCPGLATLNAYDNNLSAEAVTAVLQTLDALGRATGTVNLSGNSIPTEAGQTAAASLEAKGWTVAIDESGVTLSSIAVTPAGPSINAGATQQFTATGTYSDASAENITSSVTWSSSQTGTATITSSGLATAAAAGSTTITATLGAISGNTTLTVVELDVTDITVTPASQTIYDGHTQQYTATATYEDESTGNITSTVTWSSTSTDVATIASGGLATGEGPGSTYIVATSGSVHNSTGLTVAAVELSSIAVTPADAEIAVDDTQQYTATGTYNDSSTGNLTSGVTWDTGNSLICTIDTTGLATGVDEGTTSISATLGSIVGTTGVEVVTEQEARVYFTTVFASVTPYITTAGTPTVTWHWSDGTTSTGNQPTKNFGSAELRQHYLTVEPASALTRFGHANGSADQGIESVWGLGDFPSLNYLFFYTSATGNSLTSLDLSGCGAVTELHIAHTSASATEVDNWLIDVDEAGGDVTGLSADFYYPPVRTSASDAAYSSLVSKGWGMHPSN